jgi:ATP-dependent HslUV protease ATP-binding subunit HslU
MDNHKAFSPKEIVSELDRFIVGQNDAKKAVAIAMRNRWRRSQLPENIKEEVLPKNILMVGPTGVGKTEIARRLAKLADAPFVKVEATKFTEVGYVGRDVDSIIRDLMEIAISTTRKTLRERVKAKAEIAAEERVIDALVGADSKEETRKKFKEMLRDGKLDDKEIEIKVIETPQNPFQAFDIPGMPGAQMGMLNLSDILGKGLGQTYKFKKMTVKDSYEVLLTEESDKLLDDETIIFEAKKNTEENGIVFIDEIDKICASEHRKGAMFQEKACSEIYCRF